MIHAVTVALGKGTDRAKGFAARVVWELCAKDSTQRTFTQLHPKGAMRDTAASSKKSGLKKSGKPRLTIQEAQERLGDGCEIDYVKQVCVTLEYIDVAVLWMGYVKMAREGATTRSAGMFCGVPYHYSLEHARMYGIGIAMMVWIAGCMPRARIVGRPDAADKGFTRHNTRDGVWGYLVPDVGES